MLPKFDAGISAAFTRNGTLSVTKFNSITDLQTAQGSIDPAVYQRSAFVKQLSREGTGPGDPEKTLRTYKFEGIYPNTVSSIPLDFGATDQIEEFQVTFNYLFYEVAAPTGSF